MDADTRNTLGSLLAGQRILSLGTLDPAGWPRVSMVLFAALPDEGSFVIHVSRLAQHTQDLLNDQRVALLLVETERDSRNPQTLARLSIQAEARPIDRDDPAYSEAQAAYLKRHPNATINFQLGDFELYRLVPHSARFVAGFARIHDLAASDLQDALAQS